MTILNDVFVSMCVCGNETGRKIILSQHLIMQELLRLLWTDEHQDSHSAVKTLRSTTRFSHSLF